ncbi:FAD-dependent oxidoreductase [Companilactobacillus kimchiensis]|uniref:Glutathione reductase n=1 Tax=Companilactobacillus kimchiensis TaxID=993692 RepID=A0A0R2LH22_9LACO|nr:NAD(P)/FAD-dependent oxidoreductase [Companilactobacillus kimchiensis]KRO00727.1 glutathione reductase [Companilactobacillus kimchiensis]
MQIFDAIIIGGGVGGGAAALSLATRGYKVIIVEERDWGGTTINRGSTSKRALLASAETHYRLRQLRQPVLPLSWEEMAAHSASVTMAANQRYGSRLVKSGVTTIEGHATFVDSQTIKVHGQQYQAKWIILATGARPRMLKFPGDQYLEHSASFLKSAILPKNITIIGAGIISFALASIATEAGSKVTIVQHNQRALGIFDRDLVQKLVHTLSDAGVDFKFDNNVQSITRLSTNDYEVNTDKTTFKTNAIYCVAGRIPNFEDLNLSAMGVRFGEYGIKVDEKLQTTNPHIFALGDCCDAPVPKLSNFAIYQGKYLGTSLGSVARFSIKYPVPALTVFSLPKLGQVGISVQKAAQQSDLEVKNVDLSQWQTYSRNGDNLAQMKLVVNKGSQQIVGAEVLSQDADYLVNYLVLMMQQHVSTDDLIQQLFAYPTQASDLYGIWQAK